MRVMYQATRELRAAPGRTALITVTVGLIAVLVTMLSALAAGLSHQSTSALVDALGPDDAVIVAHNDVTGQHGRVATGDCHIVFPGHMLAAQDGGVGALGEDGQTDFFDRRVVTYTAVGNHTGSTAALGT